MEELDRKGNRNPFKVKFCTATRKNWFKRINLLIAMQLITDDNERAAMQQKIDKLEIGGEIITLDRVVLGGPKPSKQKAAAVSGIATQSSVLRKNPHHYKNKTRNFRVLANGEIRKARIRLILALNDTEVLY